MRFLAVLRFRQRLQTENRVDSRHSVLDFHVVFTHEHDLVHGRGDGGGEDDVEQEVQKDIHLVILAADQKQRHTENKDKSAVDQHGVSQHGFAHHSGIVHAEFAVIVDRRFEPMKGKYGLSESLDHRNTPHILNGLVAHAFQSVLVEPHIFLHAWTRHANHGAKA